MAVRYGGRLLIGAALGLLPQERFPSGALVQPSHEQCRREPKAHIIVTSHTDSHAALGGVKRWMSIRGSDRANPVMLFIHDWFSVYVGFGQAAPGKAFVTFENSAHVPFAEPAVKRPVESVPPPVTTDHVGVTATVGTDYSVPTAVNCCVPLAASVCGLGDTLMAESVRPGPR